MHTQLTTMRKKKYKLPPNKDYNTNTNTNTNTNHNNVVSANIVTVEKPTNINTAVPETQTQVVAANQGSSTIVASTTMVAIQQDELSPVDQATEIKKLRKEKPKKHQILLLLLLQTRREGLLWYFGSPKKFNNEV